MKKLLTYFILIFLSFNINAEISRNSIDNIKQLSWSEIVDTVSETYQYSYVYPVHLNIYAQKRASNLYFHPLEERYGKLSQNNRGEYRERIPAFNYGGWSVKEQSGNNKSWSVDKKNNQICYGGKYGEHDCVYMFEGFENSKKYFYFSTSKNEDFYARINRFQKFQTSNEFNQPFKDLNWKYVYNDKADAWNKSKNKINLVVLTNENNKLSKNINGEMQSAKKAEEKRIAEEKKAEEKRIAEEKQAVLEKRAKDAGYNSYVEMKIEELRIYKEKKAEEKRIAEEKKAEEKRIAEEKKAEEKRIAQEKLNMQISLIPSKTELQNAQNFLNDIQVFVKNNPSEFDIEEVFELMIQSKPILDGSFASNDRKNIEAFKQFAETSSIFRGFRQKRLELETQKEVQKIDKEMKTLASNISKLKNDVPDNSPFTEYLSENNIPASYQLILDNPKTLLKLQNAVKSTSLLIYEIFSTEKQIKIANSQIVKLTAYLQENMLSDLAPEVMSNLKKLKNATREETLKEKIALQKSPSQYIGIITSDVDILILDKNITTAAELKEEEDKRKAAIAKKAEEEKRIAEEKKAEEKRIAEEKKAEEKRIAIAKKNEEKRIENAKEKERLKNFKTLTMSCMYSINGRYLTYSWAYDGKKLYWEGIPINFGKSNIEQGMTTSLRKLPGKDRFNIKITGIGVMEFNNDFDSKNSEMDYMGMKAFGSCY